MDSLELTRKLYKEGYLSKEAAVATLRERDRLIKEALFVESANFFKLAIKLPSWLGGRPLPGGAPKRELGFFSRLGRGGKTPVKGAPPDEPLKGSAGWSDVGANLTKILALAGLTSASAAGFGAISQARRDKQLQEEIETSYKLMKRQHRINEMDQKKVRSHFEVLSRYAPSLAANPTVASAFVATQVSRGLIDPQMVRTLAEAQEKIDKVRGVHSTHGLPFDKATTLAQAAMVGGG